MNTNLPPYKIFSGTKSHYLAEAICAELGVELGKMNIQRFADGEFEVSFEESIRGCEVFLVQSRFPNTDNLMELLLMIDAAKRVGKVGYRRNPILRMGSSRPQGQASRVNRSKTRCRPAQHRRNRPFDYDGPARRPNSRLLQRASRPPLRFIGVYPIYRIPQSQGFGYCNT